MWCLKCIIFVMYIFQSDNKNVLDVNCNEETIVRHLKKIYIYRNQILSKIEVNFTIKFFFL